MKRVATFEMTQEVGMIFFLVALSLFELFELVALSHYFKTKWVYLQSRYLENVIFHALYDQWIKMLVNNRLLTGNSRIG